MRTALLIAAAPSFSSSKTLCERESVGAAHTGSGVTAWRGTGIWVGAASNCTAADRGELRCLDAGGAELYEAVVAVGRDTFPWWRGPSCRFRDGVRWRRGGRRESSFGRSGQTNQPITLRSCAAGGQSIYCTRQVPGGMGHLARLVVMADRAERAR